MTTTTTDTVCGKRQSVPGGYHPQPGHHPQEVYNSQGAGTGTIPTAQMRKLRHGGAPGHTTLGLPVGSWCTHDIGHLHRGYQVLGHGGRLPAFLPPATWAQSPEN